MLTSVSATTADAGSDVIGPFLSGAAARGNHGPFRPNSALNNICCRPEELPRAVSLTPTPARQNVPMKWLTAFLILMALPCAAQTSAPTSKAKQLSTNELKELVGKK